MKHTIAICDDNKQHLQIINNAIEHYFQEQLISDYTISLYTNPHELLQSSDNYKTIFLDIDMPNTDGIDVKNILEKNRYKGNIVFVTSYDEYMPKAFGKNVIAYISKDNLSKVNNVIRKIERIEEGNRVLQIANENFVLNDIYYIQSNRGYCTIYTKDKSYMYCINLSELFERIENKHFMLVHRSYVVNFHHVKKFTYNLIVLTDNRKIRLSRVHQEQFKQEYIKYLKED